MGVESLCPPRWSVGQFVPHFSVVRNYLAGFTGVSFAHYNSASSGCLCWLCTVRTIMAATACLSFLD